MIDACDDNPDETRLQVVPLPISSSTIPLSSTNHDQKDTK
jgi:hypothetical protein